MYLVAKEPDDLKTTLTYDLIGSGGYGVIIGEDWYHYRRGFFVKDRADRLEKLPGFSKRPKRPATKQDIEYLKSLLGKKWTVIRNCKTMLKDLSL